MPPIRVAISNFTILTSHDLILYNSTISCQPRSHISENSVNNIDIAQINCYSVYIQKVRMNEPVTNILYIKGGETALTEKLQNEVKSFNPIRTLIAMALVIAASYVVAFTLVPVENLEAEGGNLGI